MQQGSGPTALEPLDQGGRPQRPGDVQWRLQNHLGEVENLAEGARFGHPHPANMKVEVEIGIDHPAGRTRRQRRHDDLLAQSQHLAGGVVEARAESLPIRGRVENLQRHDARSRPRVGFAAMHQQVEGAELR